MHHPSDTESFSGAIILTFLFPHQIFQVAPSLHMVQVRKAKGDTLEFHKVTFSSPVFSFSLLPLIPYTCLKVLIMKELLIPRHISLLQFYKNLSTCLEDVVWKTEEDMQETK